LVVAVGPFLIVLLQVVGPATRSQKHLALRCCEWLFAEHDESKPAHARTSSSMTITALFILRHVMVLAQLVLSKGM
jgi:hypothetical protein